MKIQILRRQESKRNVLKKTYKLNSKTKKRKSQKMKNLFLKFLNTTSHLLPLPQLIERSEQKILLPFYHAIDEKEDLPHIYHLYPTRNTKQFEADLDFILEHFKPISLEELIQISKGEKSIEENYFHLTFDDGLRQVYEIALPILEKIGIPATVFFNTDFIDNKDLFYRYKASLLIEKTNEEKIEKNLSRINEIFTEASFENCTNKISFNELILKINFDQQESLNKLARILKIDFEKFLQEYQPYMTTEQIKDFQKRGFTIGAHSQNHPLYASLTLDEQINQTKNSIQYLQEKFQTKHKAFSFPFTDDGVERTFFEVIEMDEIADITFGCAGLKEKEFHFHFQRFPMEVADEDADILISTEYAYFLSKGLIDKNKSNRV